MKKRIKLIIGIVLLSYIAICALVGIGMTIHTAFTYPERLHDGVPVCVAEKALVNPETNKLELASFIKSGKTDDRLTIYYGMSCDEYNSITTFADTHPILTTFGTVCIAIIVGFLVIAIVGFIIAAIDEAVTEWINNGPDRKELNND